MGVENKFVKQWRETHHHKIMSTDWPRRFFDYLDTFPWATSRLLWEEIPHVVINFDEGDPQPRWTERFSGTPLARHRFIMAAYSSSQEAIIGETQEVLADIDLLYAAAPGPRYFCGADVADEQLTLSMDDFAEFSDAGVRVHVP